MSKSRDSGRGRGVSDQDEELWRQITAGIKPLRKRDGKGVASSSAERFDEAKVSVPTPESPRAPRPGERSVAPAVPARASPQPELAHGSAPGLDRRTIIKLRRGQLPVENEIDLHRKTQDQAHRALEVFLARSQTAGLRCVLIITGKGLRADGTGGILRNAVPRWLNEPPNRGRVLAFSHATPADGGEGALYVLLRRRDRT